MSREDAQFKLRMPPELKQTVELSAERNNRSLNAEIVTRLRESYGRDIDYFSATGDLPPPDSGTAWKITDPATLLAIKELEAARTRIDIALRTIKDRASKEI